ncbi:MAG: NAD(P)-dependent oxidoreductase [Bacteroidales bacterium]|nr:NAD(P)-dependent oxidoreductase [Bacteroidales bacterium]
MKIVITGSSGFVGGHFVDKCFGLGYEVFPVDIKEGFDMTNWNQVRTIDQFDLLVHLAAKLFSHDGSFNSHDLYLTNIVSTLNALELCKIRNAKMIFISSYVYGLPKNLPIREDHPASSFNPYTESKIIGERLCLKYNQYHGLPISIIRPFNLYGKGLNEELLIPTVIRGAKKGKIIVDDQRPKRDYLYISDFVDLLSGLSVYDQAGCEIFNAGSGVSYSVEKVIETVCSMYDHEIEVHSRNRQRENEIFETRADISKAMKLINWKPAVSLVEGLGLMINETKFSRAK